MHGFHFASTQELSAVAFHGEYNVGLVVASLLLVMLASYSGLSQLEIIRQQKTIWGRRKWFFLGALTLGLGVWSMHFIGMLAHKMPYEIFYDIPTTAVSILPAILAGYVTLHLIVKPQPSIFQMALAGVLLGAGIGAMHYIGMAAMYGDALLVYRPSLFLLSIVFAVLLAFLALSVPYWLSSVIKNTSYQRLMSAILMGLAVSGMHYIAMGAAVFLPAEDLAMPPFVVSTGVLRELAISVSSLLIVIAVVSAILIERLHIMQGKIDISESRLYQLANYDQLTELPNRLFLHGWLEQALKEGRLHKDWIASVVFELENLSDIIASEGQAHGDVILKRMGRHFQQSISTGSIVARTGDVQFTVVQVLKGADEESARRKAEQLAEDLRGCVLQGERGVLSVINVGISLVNGGNPDDALLKSVSALSLARRSLGRMAHFNPEAQEQLRVRRQNEEEIRQALLNDEFILYVQPQFDADGKECIGAEALVRWNHPSKGLIGPGDFIPLAEEMGVIVELGTVVLEKACQILQRWQQSDDYRHLVLSVNVSADQFRRTDFIQKVVDALDKYQLPSSCIKLEITESMAMENVRQAVDTIKTLKSHGIRFSMDDFGTGYSSLSYFSRLPFDEVKIDKSFVQTDMDEQGLRDWMIIEGIIAMAKRLGMSVVAEGVETTEQHERLIKNGRPMVQGYLFGKPMLVDDFERNLSR